MPTRNFGGFIRYAFDGIQKTHWNYINFVSNFAGPKCRGRMLSETDSLIIVSHLVIKHDPVVSFSLIYAPRTLILL